jgi:glutathione S-transferase
MVQIWGRPTSLCTQRALWGLEEFGVPYKVTLASGTMGASGHISKGTQPYGVVDSAEYLRLNPTGRIPTIQDGHFTLWESNAILLYLALKHGHDRSAVAAEELATAAAWMSWSNQYLDPPLTDLVLQKVRLPLEKRSKDVVDRWNQEMVEHLQILDGHLADRDFVAGSAPSIAEFSIGPYVHRWVLFELPHENLSNLFAWHARLCVQPAFQKIVQPAEFHLEG